LEGIKGTRILLTGSSGFIGSHLGRALVGLGAELHLLDSPGASDFRIRDFRSRCSVHELDLTDLDSLRRLVREIRPEKIFHLASITTVDRSLDQSLPIVNNNLIGTLNLIDALNGVDYHCFVNTGTCEEYGDNPTPFSEDQRMNPVSPYSAAKASATIFCRMYHKTLDLPIVTVRPFLTYGPFQSPGMLIPRTIVSALKGKPFKMTAGEQTREFNYVSDIVNGFILASTTSEAIGQIINIGNGIEYSILDVVEKILAAMSKPIRPDIGALPYRSGEAWHFYCDNRKAKTLLGWSPSITLEEGIGKTVAWYRDAHESGLLSDFFPDS